MQTNQDIASVRTVIAKANDVSQILGEKPYTAGYAPRIGTSARKLTVAIGILEQSLSYLKSVQENYDRALILALDFDMAAMTALPVFSGQSDWREAAGYTEALEAVADRFYAAALKSKSWAAHVPRRPAVHA